MGYKLAGFDVVGNNEIDAKINELYVKNFHPRFNYNMPIQEMVKLTEFPEELFNLDILDGSPPCSTFSLSGLREKVWGEEKKFREGQAEQVLDDLFFEFIKLAKILQPKVIIAENVKGLIIGKAKGYVNEIIKKLSDSGYYSQIFLLNAATMGVPQKRERVFFICTRKDLNLPKVNLSFKEPPILYGDFKDSKYKPINPETATYRRWTRRANIDKSVGDTVARTEGGKVSQFTTPYIKDNQTPNTMTASVTPVRFDVPGFLSDRDIVIIQSFPLDYDFNGYDVQYICGMSVPPIMMEKIARQVKEQLLDKGGNRCGEKES